MFQECLSAVNSTNRFFSLKKKKNVLLFSRSRKTPFFCFLFFFFNCTSRVSDPIIRLACLATSVVVVVCRFQTRPSSPGRIETTLRYKKKGPLICVTIVCSWYSRYPIVSADRMKHAKHIHRHRFRFHVRPIAHVFLFSTVRMLITSKFTAHQDMPPSRQASDQDHQQRRRRGQPWKKGSRKKEEVDKRLWRTVLSLEWVGSYVSEY